MTSVIISMHFHKNALLLFVYISLTVVPLKKCMTQVTQQYTDTEHVLVQIHDYYLNTYLFIWEPHMCYKVTLVSVKNVSAKLVSELKVGLQN